MPDQKRVSCMAATRQNSASRERNGSAELSMPYHAREFRPGLWEVVDESGHPVYGRERDGNDKPLVFRDPDVADECAAILNAENEQPTDLKRL